MKTAWKVGCLIVEGVFCGCWQVGGGYFGFDLCWRMENE
jgi:hypothetical protein